MDITLKLFAEENDIELPRPNTWEYSDIYLLAYKELWSVVDSGKRFYHEEELKNFFRTYADWIEHLISTSHDADKKRKRMKVDADTIIILEEL